VILAVGCKLTHNGTVGFGLRLPADRLVRANADGEVHAEHYPASLAIQVSTGALLEHLLCAAGLQRGTASSWDAAEVRRWRERLQAPGLRDLPEPVLHGVEGGTAAAFFSALRRALPRDAILVTDSGLHQILARRYFDVFAPRGLILPTDFQSMGFGVPAAIGAKLAAPRQPVVAIVGDGGFLMSGMELVTAVRERVPLTVVVFNDGQLNQIRLQQHRDFGHAHSVELGTPDLETFAASVGLGYLRVAGDVEAGLRAALASQQPTLVEVAVGDSPAIRVRHAKGLTRGAVRGLLGARSIGWLKRMLGRGGAP
jgi:acetolactate synthase-1/2/3 large subunit